MLRYLWFRFRNLAEQGGKSLPFMHVFSGPPVQKTLQDARSVHSGSTSRLNAQELNKWPVKYFLFLLIVIAGIFLFCAKSPKNEIIAKVGDHTITVDEFKYSYEFSFAPTRTGPNPRKTYLDYMIKEKLLALEGYKKGYQKSSYVKRRMSQRRYLDVLESYYQEHVHDKVKISEDEIQDALKKGTVKFRMRIWPTEDLDHAKKALAEARKIGLPQYMKKQFEKKEIPLDREKQFETDWIDFLDIRPEVLDGIKDLQVGEISAPIPFNTGYALFQVLDIQRQGIKVEELERGVKRKRMMDRLHNIQADKIVHALMDSILTPMEIRVNAKLVDKLAPLLFNWVNDGLPTGIYLPDFFKNPLPDSSKQYLKDLQAMLDETLVTYHGGKKSVRDYIRYMDYYRRNLKRKSSLEEFEPVLLTEIGRMMKNDVFVMLGEKQGYERADSVAKDLHLWQDKWVYEAYRIDQVKGLAATEDEERAYFKKNWKKLPVADVDTSKFEKYRPYVRQEILHEKQLAILDEELQRLYKKYPVWIDEKKLNALDLDDKDRSRNISLFVRKRFSNQAAVPTVDMKWISF